MDQNIRPLPSTGSTWMHESGTLYTVLCVSNVDAIRPGWSPTVVYVAPDGRVYSRPVTMFFEKFERVEPSRAVLMTTQQAISRLIEMRRHLDAALAYAQGGAK
jgi:hypothetical protein